VEAGVSDLETRLDRVESELAIRQLPARYALAVDSRDLQALGDLFVEDVDNGRAGVGRDALRTWFADVLAKFYRSMHFVSGHVIDFSDADHATGVVYCRAEHEDGDGWIVMTMCYYDTYERRDGRWYFRRRVLKPWYVADADEHPQAGETFARWPGREHRVRLPHEFSTWSTYWATRSDDEIAAVTRQA
jgi:ketosteroid isomerase-like protein